MPASQNTSLKYCINVLFVLFDQNTPEMSQIKYMKEEKKKTFVVAVTEIPQ